MFTLYLAVVFGTSADPIESSIVLYVQTVNEAI